MDKSEIQIWQNPIHFLATGLGSGFLPFCPGTWGTLVGLFLYLLFCHQSIWVVIGIVALGFVAGVYFCQEGMKALGVYDHPAIVWDEIVGIWLTLMIYPVHPFILILGFLFFRLFDIWKPFPIRFLEKRFQNGFGIMLDDLLAAVYASLALGLVLFFLISSIRFYNH